MVLLCLNIWYNPGKYRVPLLPGGMPMKSFLISLISFYLLFVSFFASAGEYELINPGFEKSLSGWYQWDSNEGYSAGEISSEYRHNGNLSGRRYLINPLQGTYSCFAQELTIKVNPGDEIIFGGWLMSPSDDPLRYGAVAFLAIEFWSKGEKIIYPESQRLSSQSDWVYFEISATVPNEADAVKVGCFLNGDNGSQGSVYFDDLSVLIRTE